MALKKAVAVGINYEGTTQRLTACVKDAQRMGAYLESRGYQVEYLLEGQRPGPTKREILAALGRLMAPGTTHAVFYYSGHGMQTAKRNPLEVDGRDEAIVPLDYVRAGVILDDQLRVSLEGVPSGCVFWGFFDCCNSATVMDLLYTCTWGGGAPSTATNPGKHLTHDRVVCCVSASLDDQVAVDAGDYSVFTRALLETLPRAHTYEQLLRGLDARTGATQKPAMSFGGFVDLGGAIDL